MSKLVAQLPKILSPKVSMCRASSYVAAAGSPRMTTPSMLTVPPIPLTHSTSSAAVSLALALQPLPKSPLVSSRTPRSPTGVLRRPSRSPLRSTPALDAATQLGLGASLSVDTSSSRWADEVPARDRFLISHPLASGPRTVMFMIRCDEALGVVASTLPSSPSAAVMGGASFKLMSYKSVADRVEAGELLVVHHPDPWLLMVTPADEMVPGLWTTLSEHARVGPASFSALH